MSNASRFQFVMWKDIFMLADDGGGRVEDYAEVLKVLRAQHARYPTGLGGICILPDDTKPPAAPMRAAIAATLEAMSPMMLSYAWVVEGTGFKAAAVRGVLVSLNMFSRRKYATYVATNVRNALAWVLPHLDGGIDRLVDVPTALIAIEKERNKLLRDRFVTAIAS